MGGLADCRDYTWAPLMGWDRKEGCMVIREQRIPANDRNLSISERFCLSDGNRKTGPASGVCCCERERARAREREKGGGDTGTALPDPLYGFNSNEIPGRSQTRAVTQSLASQTKQKMKASATQIRAIRGLPACGEWWWCRHPAVRCC